MTKEILGTVTAAIDGDTIEVAQEAVKLPELGWITNGQILRVIDGDTVEVSVVRKLRVRLRNCWAPERETNQQWKEFRAQNGGEAPPGVQSMRHLRDMAEGFRARIQVIGSEDDEFSDVTSMGRVIGDVYLLKNGTNLAEAQVSAGHATREKIK